MTNPNTILIVEDDPLVLNLVSRVVTSAHPSTRLLTAPNGEEGLSLARQEQPDLIISDLSMPKMDGFDMVWSLQQQQAGPQPPIIGMSGDDLAGAKTGAFLALCDEFLTKPFRPTQLLEKIAALTGRDRDREVDGAPPALPGLSAVYEGE